MNFGVVVLASKISNTNKTIKQNKTKQKQNKTKQTQIDTELKKMENY